MSELDAVKVDFKSGDESFRYGETDLKLKLIDFWSWSQSDLINNSLRGVLAEFIVSQDLGITNKCRVEWDVCDLVMKDGIKIEVKSSAYLQSWKQKCNSKISFDIRPTTSFCEETSKYTEIIKRQSDFYVFSLLHHKDKKTIDPLNLEQWTFFVLPTKIIDEKIPFQKTITLGSLQRLQPIECRFGEIKQTITSLASLLRDLP